MNEQELSFSKLSYVNRDFASIYPDLLDLVKEITNRWDPSASNESDPGVVLLKIGAFLADHLNYNIDKNILECFLPSATQEESARRIAEFGGYTPRYYRSAVGNVSVNYNPEVFEQGFVIPPFSLIVGNSDNSIVYTQLDSIQIDQKNVPVAGRFIEGTIQRLLVDSDVITLDNLDDNRIYLPITHVAENGIFIYNISNGARTSQQWTKTNYLYTRPIGTKCYKLDYDSNKELPYIEFPSDIANLIEDGLAIYYVQTAGSYGNVTAGELNTLVNIDPSNTELKSLNIEDFRVSNAKSITNGAEPENIDEIYNSYKKVVGTFDTLVSLQDYSNAVKTATNDLGEPIVSNGLVTDRRVDYNNAVNVCTMKSNGTGFTNVSINKFAGFTFLGALATAPTNVKEGCIYTNTTDSKTYLCTGFTGQNAGEPVWEQIDTLTTIDLYKYLQGMTPYDLIIYALQKYSEADYNSIYYYQALENSFKQIPGSISDEEYDLTNTEQELITELEEHKCLSHVFRNLDDGQVYCFKNYVPLKVDIVPYTKVTKYERNEILNNIRKAISDNFNASKVEFGEELNYDTVKKVIESADSRINYVTLADFNYYTRVMLKNYNPNLAEELSLEEEFDGSTFIADLAAKNVLAGRLCLFNFDNNFDYQYCQTECEPLTNIINIKSELRLRSNNNVASYTEFPQFGTKDNPRVLEKDEYVEIFYPSYYSEKTYGTYVLYNFEPVDVTKVIPAGMNYTLTGTEELNVYYKSESNNTVRKTYKAGDIICPSFDLMAIDNPNNNRQQFDKDGNKYNQLGSDETISLRVLLQTVFNTNRFVYWIVNNTGGKLFDAGQTLRVLGEGEFFIYTDSTKENLTILGRGTKLIRSRVTGTDEMILTDGIENKVSRDQLNSSGLAAKIPFINFNFANSPLTIVEMDTVTLGEGDKFWFEVIQKTTDGVTPIVPGDTTWLGYDYLNYYIQGVKNVGYILYDDEDGEIHELPAQEESSLNPYYLARSRLDLNLSKTSPAQIQGDDLKAHVITVKTAQNIEAIINGGSADYQGKFIQSNIDLNITGNITNDGVDLSIFDNDIISINWLIYRFVPNDGVRWVPTDRFIMQQDNLVNTWCYGPDQSGTFIYKLYDSNAGKSFDPTGRITTPGWETFVVCEKIEAESTDLNMIQLNYPLEFPNLINLPFSLIWYDTSDTEESFVENDREYICQIMYTNPDDVEGKVKASFLKATDTGEVEIPLNYYGNIGSIEKSSAVDSENIYQVSLLENSANYISPAVGDSEDGSTIYLRIESDSIPNGYITINNPRVVWGGNTDLNAYKADVEDRINELLARGDNFVQFHWLNEPTGDLAMINSNLTDSYSLFDKNNVANIITIPEIDFRSSSIDIVKSMRNY